MKRFTLQKEKINRKVEAKFDAILFHFLKATTDFANGTSQPYFLFGGKGAEVEK